MKKILSLLLVLVALMTATIIPVSATGVVTIYSPNGGSSLVMDYELDYYCSKGWYAYPVTTMYSIDGRETIIRTHEVEYYKSLGWYTEPIVTMYALDGRTTLILQSEIEYYQSLGWYAEPLVTLYDIEGRTNIVLQSEVLTYITKGWYTMPVDTSKVRNYPGTIVPDFGSLVGVKTFFEEVKNDYIGSRMVETEFKWYLLTNADDIEYLNVYDDYLNNKGWQFSDSTSGEYIENLKGWLRMTTYEKGRIVLAVCHIDSLLYGPIIYIAYAVL